MRQSNHQETSTNDTVDLGAVFHTLLKGWLSICLIAAAVVGLATFILIGKTKIYSAETTIKIEPRALRPLGREVQSAGESWGMYWANKEYYSTQYELLKSRSLAEEVARNLSLHTDPRFMQGLGPQGELEVVVEAPTITDAAMKVQGLLTVAPEEDTRLVILSFEDADPERAQRIVLEIANTYIRRNLDSSVEAIGDASTWLSTQLDELKTELESSEMSLHDYKREKNLVSASLLDKSNMLRAEMVHLNAALTHAKTLREGLSSRVRLLSKVDENEPDKLPAQELLDSGTLSSFREAYIQATTMVDSLTQEGKGENHPAVLKAAASVSIAHAALVREVLNIKSAAKASLSASNHEIAGLKKLYEEAEERAFDLNLLEIEYNRLTRTKENTERLHDIVLERSRESELNSRMRFNNITIVDPPLLPLRPIRPKIPLGIAFGGIMGLSLGFAFVLLRERLDQRLKTPHDIEQHLGVPCVGAIPHWQTSQARALRLTRKSSQKKNDGSKPELFVQMNPNSPEAEAVRSLRTNLLFMSPDSPLRSLLITSPSPNDGKTTIACSLAISLAQSGKSVLLLDGDLRKARLSSLFADEVPMKGLTTSILQPSSLSKSYLQTDIPTLTVLPTGPLPPNPAELLHSTHISEVIQQLSREFDHVIIDSPPLMPVTDGAILSKLADATLLIVRTTSTQRDHARFALRSLRDVDAKIAGVILNGATALGGYDYYYGSNSTFQEPS